MVKNKVKNVELVTNNILVYVKVPDTTTESGLTISEDTARAVKKDITGEILIVGPDVENFKVGETILLPPHGSTPVSIDSEVYHVFRETSLFGKIKK
tara:strand:+ start:952 stop:1242 length:291 start_codon:yes stop_codon:yes gene_type:complete